MGSLRVGHDWATSLSLFTFMHWRRKWQPPPVFFLAWRILGAGNSGGLRSMGSHRVGHDRNNLAAAVGSVEKAMAPHSSTLAWKLPWTEEPSRLQSMRSLRVGHDWATSLWLFIFMHWRTKWQPTPVFLLGESQGRGSLVGCRLWGRTESDTTEVT